MNLNREKSHPVIQTNQKSIEEAGKPRDIQKLPGGNKSELDIKKFIAAFLTKSKEDKGNRDL